MGVPSGLLRATQAVTAFAPTVMTQSGRWVKLTEESAQALKQAADPTMGALRNADGKFFHILKLDKGGPVTPATLLSVSNVAVAMAAYAEAQELKAYLAQMNATIDAIYRSDLAQQLGVVEGQRAILDEALAVFESVGTVSDVTWTKVSQCAVTLHQLQSTALHQLRMAAEELEQCRKHDKNLDEALSTARKSVPIALASLAEALRLQANSDVLELARVEATHPEQLADHQTGLSQSRQQRREEILSRLKPLTEELMRAGAIPRGTVVSRPFLARSIARDVQSAGSDVATFAHAADFPEIEAIRPGDIDWTDTVSQLVDETSDAVRTKVKDAGRGARFGAGRVLGGTAKVMAAAAYRTGDAADKVAHRHEREAAPEDDPSEH